MESLVIGVGRDGTDAEGHAGKDEVQGSAGGWGRGAGSWGIGVRGRGAGGTGQGLMGDEVRARASWQ